MKRLFMAVLALVLAGCGTSVRIRHPWVVSRVGSTDLPGLGNLYVVLDRVESRKATGFAGSTLGAMLSKSLGSSGNSAINRPLTPGEETGILRAVSTSLPGPWIGLAGWSVGNATTTRFLEEIRPSMVLVIRPGLVEARQDKETVTDHDKDGKATGSHAVFRLYARFEVAYVLKDWQTGRVSARGGFNREANAESPQEAKLADWLDSQGGIMSDWIADLKRDLLPVPAERIRWVREGKKPGPADSEWNAGITSEQAGDWAGARMHYISAIAGFPGKKWKERQELQGYINELDRIAPPPQGAIARPLSPLWAQPVAVLPFANDSNNVTAPEELRKAVANRLVMMGYQVVPLETTDAGLRARGVTIGEHLRSLKPEEISPAAGATRMIAGKVETFSTVNVGIYFKQEVTIRLWMLDTGGLPVWESAGTGFRESSSDKPAQSFLAGLIGGVAQKMTGTYLKEEGNTAVLGAVGGLPARGVR